MSHHKQRFSPSTIQTLGRVGCVFGLAIAAYLIFSTPESRRPAVRSGMAAENTGQSAIPPGVGTTPIQELRVGDRVLAHNPEVSSEQRADWTEPDWATYYLLELVMVKPDGARLEIQILRDEAWVLDQLGYTVESVVGAGSVLKPLDSEGSFESGSFVVADQVDQASASFAAVPLSPLRAVYRRLAVDAALIDVAGGSLVGLTIELDLPELGITGPAVVQSLEPCPAVRPPQPGPANQVVTATFAHTSGDVIDLEVERGADQAVQLVAFASAESAVPSAAGAAGGRSTERIGTTSNHPFWSVDRQAYVQAGSLEVGERLLTHGGETKRVVSKLARPGPEPVYNLEVHGEHVYFVGTQGLLVHNSQQYNAPNSVAPDDVAFSQRTVGGNVTQYVDDMANGRWDWSRSGPINVMRQGDRYVSFDNRRLMAARQANLSEIPINVVDPKAIRPGTKMTWEEAFRRRFTDPRNKRAGGVVPEGGLIDLPTIAPKKN